MAFFYEGTDKVVAHNAELMGDNDSMFVKAGVTIGSATDWDGVDGTTGESVQVFGTIMSVGGNAFFATGNNDFIRIGIGGAISGGAQAGAGISIGGGNARIVNDSIVAGATAIDFTGDDNNSVTNTGLISASNGYAIHMAAVSGHIVNSGTISASESAAIRIDGTSDSGPTVIDNSGTINGAADGFKHAIEIANGAALITNTGYIGGGISLGDGDDLYDGSLGRVDGVINAYGGDDAIYGGAEKNAIDGGAGTDTLEGGGGRDTFYFDQVSDTTGTRHDIVLDFDARKDILGFGDTPTAIDTKIATGHLDAAHFDSDLAHAVTKGKMGAHHAVLFTPNSGDEAGHTFLIVDGNGNAGYQTDKDYVIDITHASNLDALSVSNFI